MDNKTQNLDPQLKAAYDRVMGTNVTPSTSPSPSPVVPQPTVSVQGPQVAQPIAAAPHVSGGPKDPGATSVIAGGSRGGKISPILVVVALVLFFLVYTFVCFMIFGVKIPFISS